VRRYGWGHAYSKKKCYIWSTAVNGVEHWILQNVIRYTGNVLICGAGKRWMDCARSNGLHRSNEERNILQTRKVGKVNLNCYIWITNCLLRNVIGGKVKG